jgi:VIT1/CCC1 family predicted Fe2+/Mn2+ transporter
MNPDDLSDLEATHTPERIRIRLQDGARPSYLRDFVYGAIDGAVTTFAVVSGTAGAGLSTGIVIVLGAANLLGDGCSMALGNYLGTRAQEQQHRRTRLTEARHIEVLPHGEREEVRQIFLAKGLAGDDLERIVDAITSDVERWINTMMVEEHGLPLRPPAAVTAALVTLAAFVGAGLIPLLPFIVWHTAPSLGAPPFLFSTVMTGAAFFAIGTLKSRFVGEGWLRAGLETLLIGGLAAGLAFLAGFLLHGLAGAP